MATFFLGLATFFLGIHFFQNGYILVPHRDFFKIVKKTCKNHMSVFKNRFLLKLQQIHLIQNLRVAMIVSAENQKHFDQTIVLIVLYSKNLPSSLAWNPNRDILLNGPNQMSSQSLID